MSSTLHDILTNPVALIAVGGALYKVITKVYRWISNYQVSQTFVEQMATNHLPHIYHVQTLICDKLGVEVTEPTPHINFVKLADKDKD